MNIEPIKTDIDQSFQTVAAAVEGKSERLSDAMRRLGKRCRPNWIARQGYPSTDVKRTNFLASFKTWIAAFLLIGDVSGAEMLLNELEIFVKLCRRVIADTKTNTVQLPKQTAELIRQIVSNSRALQELLTE